eukprot:TRINITY_DN3494_c0_g1_i1.p1 TRINITY_DN3494_c0_g1~~TRINITY_DN3494_c0_g1_i1.p1  ORF type:complete len:164 (+),score=66.43 TRINITY_DN3494_c0_g1_i1:65-556(+)
MIRSFSSLSRVLRHALRAEAAEASSAAGAKKLSLNLTHTNDVLFDGPVDAVYVPSRSGNLAFMPGREKTIAQLKPGVLTVQTGSETLEYFVSGGFAFIDGSHADISAVEAVPLDYIDGAAVNTALDQYNQKLTSAANEQDKVLAQIGVEVYSAMKAALAAKAK